tara:strand:- start:427 stop:912 length:486 start_codon:yes stop_codon:yes gene_type:complete
MDLSNNAQVDLLYLTNPNFKLKYNKQEKKNILDNDDVKFYRKRILQTTKEYLRGNKLTIEINNAFEEYANLLIQHYKFIDKKELIQSDYKDIPKKQKTIDISNFKITEENALMMKKPEIIKKTIKDFIPIVVKERKKKQIIIPKQKKYDLKNPKNRKKKSK